MTVEFESPYPIDPPPQGGGNPPGRCRQHSIPFGITLGFELSNAFPCCLSFGIKLGFELSNAFPCCLSFGITLGFESWNPFPCCLSFGITLGFELSNAFPCCLQPLSQHLCALVNRLSPRARQFSGGAVVRQYEDARVPADIGYCIALEVEIESGVERRTHGKFVHHVRPLLASRAVAEIMIIEKHGDHLRPLCPTRLERPTLELDCFIFDENAVYIALHAILLDTIHITHRSEHIFVPLAVAYLIGTIKDRFRIAACLHPAVEGCTQQILESGAVRGWCSHIMRTRQ